MRRQKDRGATFLALLRIIGDQPHREIVVRLEQDLAAQQEAVAVVDPATGNHILEEAVTLDVNAVDPRRDGFAQRHVDRAVDAAIAIIADRQGTADKGGELGLGGDHRDHAGRGVAAEQCALRPAQHFDPVERPELGQGNAGARPIDAVDIGRDRAFETGVVANRSDAADASGRSAAFGGGRGDQQGWRQLGQRPKIGRAAVLERIRGDRADRHRNVGQGLVPAGRGNDDVAGVDRLLFLSAIVDCRGIAGGRTLGRSRRALGGIGLGRLGRRLLRQGRSRQYEQAGGSQPHGLADHSRSPLKDFPSTIMTKG